MAFTVTPWDVEGSIDYQKLIQQFGTKPISEELYKKIQKKGPLHVFLRRKYFFSHRDLDLVLKDADEGKGFFLYTGRAPSGPMHIGHLLPFIMNKWLQDVFGVNLYIQIPDEEKFLARDGKSLEKIDELVKSDLQDIAALGFDPNKTFIFQNREYASHLYTKAVKVAKKITFSTAKAVFGFENETNIGWIFYPAMQIVPTLFEKKRCLIPAGIDQDNYWRIQRDIAESLGYQKAAAIHSKFLPPLTGMSGKMSSSRQQTAIFLSDTKEQVHEKIMKHAFSGGAGSLKEHREKGGNPDIDVSFQWLKIFFEEDDKKLQELESGYRSGKVTTGEMKSHLIEKINTFLAQHQKEKKKADNLLRQYKYDGKLAKQMWEQNND